MIHQIWYQGQTELPAKFRPNQKSWKKMHPTWKYMLWDKNTMQNLINKYPKYIRLYKNFKYMHQKIDFFKYLMLYDQGGVYIDMDAKPLKPLDGLLDEFLYANVIVSELPINKIESYLVVGFERMINNGTIFAISGSPFLIDLVEKINQEPSLMLTLSKYQAISRTTGPKKFTEVALNHSNDCGMVILPSKYLEPCYSNDNECEITTDSYINHEHSQTWLNPLILHLAKLYFLLKNKWYIILGIVIIFFYYLR